jgi:4-hydroxy-3-methylbut-2-en-1-yl diphosphate synthase IspG/GcpE
MSLDQAASERQHAADLGDAMYRLRTAMPEVVTCLGCGRSFFNIEDWSRHYDEVCE